MFPDPSGPVRFRTGPIGREYTKLKGDHGFRPRGSDRIVKRVHPPSFLSPCLPEFSTVVCSYLRQYKKQYCGVINNRPNIISLS